MFGKLDASTTFLQPTILVLSQVYLPAPAAVGQCMHEAAVGFSCCYGGIAVGEVHVSELMWAGCHGGLLGWVNSCQVVWRAGWSCLESSMRRRSHFSQNTSDNNSSGN
jgi:hypothetical protein